MADTGFLTAGTVVGSNGTGTTWSNATAVRLASSDNSYATSASSTSSQSRWLQLSNFGFSVPAGAKIDGVEVAIERSISAGGTTITDRDLKLSTEASDANSAFSAGTNKADTSTAWTTTDTTITYGGPTDKWGHDLTPNIVNNSAFGLVFKAQRTAGSGNAQIDRIQVKIYYTTGSLVSSDTGWLVSSSETNDVDSGTSWANLSNIRADDNANADVTLAIAAFSKTALATGYGAAVPGTAIIEGIEIIVRRYATVVSATVENIAQLLLAGTKSGTNKAANNALGTLPTSETQINLGGLGKTFDLALTPSDVNNANFGFAYRVNQGGVLGVANVDYVAIKIYYYDAGLTRVTTTLSSSFSAQQRITKTLSSSYSAKQRITKNLVSTYNARQKITKDLACSFSSLQRIVEILDSSYSAVQRITNDLVSSYSSVSALTRVYASLESSYNSKERIVQDLQCSYSSLQRITQGVNSSFSGLQRIQKTQSFSYSSKQRITKTVSFSFNAKQRIIATLTCSYSSRQRIYKKLICEFSALQRITKTHSFSYNSLQRITKQIISSYSAKQRVIKLLESSYNAEGGDDQPLARGMPLRTRIKY